MKLVQKIAVAILSRHDKRFHCPLCAVKKLRGHRYAQCNHHAVIETVLAYNVDHEIRAHQDFGTTHLSQEYHDDCVFCPPQKLRVEMAAGDYFVQNDHHLTVITKKSRFYKDVESLLSAAGIKTWTELRQEPLHVTITKGSDILKAVDDEEKRLLEEIEL